MASVSPARLMINKMRQINKIQLAIIPILLKEGKKQINPVEIVPVIEEIFMLGPLPYLSPMVPKIIEPKGRNITAMLNTKKNFNSCSSGDSEGINSLARIDAERPKSA